MKCCDDAIELVRQLTSLALTEQYNKLEAVDNFIKLELAEIKRKLAEATAALDVQRLTLVRSALTRSQTKRKLDEHGDRLEILERTVGCRHSQDVGVDKIKPCPFCGEEGRLEWDVDNDDGKTFFFVQCKYCDAETGNCSDSICAIKIWNKRV